MPTLTLSERAFHDLDRLAEFLTEESPAQGAEITDLILEAIRVLQRHPLIGRPTDLESRQLVISHGRSGYMALYEFDPVQDHVLVMRIRHQREAGFND